MEKNETGELERWMEVLTEWCCDGDERVSVGIYRMNDE